MEIAQITDQSVREALEGVRQAKVVPGNPLVRMEALRARLQREGMSVSPGSLEWALGALLHEVIGRNLANLRVGRPGEQPGELDPGRERLALARDFQEENVELEAWSCLFYRYVSGLGLPQHEIAAIARPGYQYGIRHLQRRLLHGFGVLRRQLQDLEREAMRATAGAGAARRDVAEQALPGNLPVQSDHFIGRAADIATIRRFLDQSRLITLLGPGGVGKTRLALEAAAAERAAFAAGAWFVPLEAHTAADLLPQAVADALGIQGEPGIDATQRLIQALAGRRILLVLDNCEHMVEAAARLAGLLLGRCAGLRIIATSREALRIAGEQVWHVAPLGLPETDEPEALASEAVRLFVDRAERMAPGAAPGAAELATIAEICRRLDGIPLAIELAAARAHALAPRAILDRLDGFLDFLDHGDRAAQPRHRTLRQAIAWSHALLPEPERVCFRRLAVFQNGCTLDAVEAVCAGDPLAVRDIAHCLAGLVDRSLVKLHRGEGEPRYRMLETIRRFGLELLDASPEAPALRERHLAWCLDLAERAARQLGRAEQTRWLRVLEHENDNLRAALEWSKTDARAVETGLLLGGALEGFWQQQGAIDEGRERLTGLLVQDTTALASAARARALRCAGALTSLKGDRAQARALVDQSRMICEALGDQRGLAASEEQLGRVAQADGDVATARAWTLRALERYQATGQGAGQARCLAGLGTLEAGAGHLAGAAAAFEASLAIARGEDDPGLCALALGNLGHLRWRAGDLDGARAHYAASLEDWRRQADARGSASALVALGSIAHWQRDLATARACFQQGLDSFRSVDDRRGMAAVWVNLGRVDYEQRNHVAARAAFSASLAVALEAADTEVAAEAFEGLAAVDHAAEAWARAVHLFALASRLRPVGTGTAVDAESTTAAHLAELRARLGEGAYQSAWEFGRGAVWETVADQLLDLA